MYVTPQRIKRARAKTKLFRQKTLRQAVQNQCIAGDDIQAFGWLKRKNLVSVSHYPVFRIAITEAGENYLKE